MPFAIAGKQELFRKALLEIIEDNCYESSYQKYAIFSFVLLNTPIRRLRIRLKHTNLQCQSANFFKHIKGYAIVERFIYNDIKERRKNKSRSKTKIYFFDDFFQLDISILKLQINCMHVYFTSVNRACSRSVKSPGVYQICICINANYSFKVYAYHETTFR